MIQVSIVLVGLVGLRRDGISVLDELCMGSQVYGDMGCGSMQLALIGDGCPLNSTASATASTEAGMQKTISATTI